MDLLDLCVKVGVEDNATSKVASIANSAQNAVSSLANKLGAAYTSVQNATGAIVGTVGTLAATGGIERALSIEGARAKLEGLGHTGEDLENIMNNAKAAVNGTSYGLGEAASAAGVLAAAGVEAGEGVGQMQGVLSTIGAVATVSGREFSEVSSIFGKVAANGKLTTEVMNQLQDSGIPVLSMLAQHFNVTTEEMSQMVTDGKVSFQEFNQVMNDNMGQAAVVAGQTFPSAVKNLRAALSKTGAEVATPVLDNLKQIILALNPVINALVPVATQLGTAISEHLQKPVEIVVNWLGQLKNTISGGGVTTLLENISPAAVAAGAGLLAFSSGGIATLLSQVPILGSVLSSFTGVFGFLGAPIGVALAALVAFGAASGDLQAAFAPVVQQLGEVLPQAFSTVVNWFNQLTPLMQPLVAAFSGLAAEVVSLGIAFLSGIGEGINNYVMPALESFLPALTELTNGLTGTGGALEPVVEMLGETLGAAVGVAMECLTFLMECFTQLLPYIAPLVAAFMQIVNAVGGIVTAFLGGLLPTIQELLMPIIEQLMPVFTTLFENLAVLMEKLEPLATFLGTVLGVAIAVVVTAFQGVVEIVNNVIVCIGMFIDWLPSAVEGIGNFVNGVINWFMGLPGAIGGFISSIWTAIADWVTNLINKAWELGSGFFNNIVNFFSQLPSNVWNLLIQVLTTINDWCGNIINKAWQAGSDFLNNLMNFFWQLPGNVWNALCSVINNIGGFVSDMGSKAWEAACNFGSNLLDTLWQLPQKAMDAGAAIIQGIIDGINGMINAAGDAISGVVDKIASFLPHSPAKQGAFSGKGWTPYSGRAIVQGLAEGIEDMASEPINAIDSVMNGISGAMSASGNVNINSNASGMAGTAASLERVEGLLTQLLNKDTSLYMDATKVSSALTMRSNSTIRARGLA